MCWRRLRRGFRKLGLCKSLAASRDPFLFLVARGNWVSFFFLCIVRKTDAS